MKRKKIIRYGLYTLFLFLTVTPTFFSCEDPYELDDKEPDWLGASIYNYLESSGEYSYYLKLIHSVSDAGMDYAEVLSKTGSKTLFVAKDEAFERFFQSNQYGIRSFDEMSDAQKRAILFASMLDDAYLLEMLSSTPGGGGVPPARGQAMRRVTSWQILDSIPIEKGDYLPQNVYWERFKENGIHVLRDNTRWTMVHFMQAYLTSKNITDEDITYITGIQRQKYDAHIFGIKVIGKDVTCKNGYVHVLEDVLFPPSNMAQYIRDNKETSLFNHFLERYCAPYPDIPNTLEYRRTNPNFTDTIFYKRFFTTDFPNDPQGRKKEGTLTFDPGINAYSAGGSMATDMAAMFVPNNAALDEYFNNGAGKFLKERFGEWDSIPDNVLSVLVSNHLRPSFNTSVPSRFAALQDKMGTPIGIKPADIQYAQVCPNGVVYVTDNVYAPTEYISVVAPVLIGANTKIFNWAIKNQQFDLYLLSMVNRFTFLVPTDEEFNNYLNPVSVAKPIQERWKFTYDTRTANVRVTVYDANTGDSIRALTASTTVGDNSNEVNNAINDIMDNHIIVGDLVPGKRFYSTKGGATLWIDPESGNLPLMQGGGNIEQGTGYVYPSIVYPMQNGNTFLLNSIMQMPTRSVYDILQNEEQFSKFFELCQGSTTVEITEGGKTTVYGGNIFYKDKSFAGIDLNVEFFNTFHYTVYVPTNEAIDAELASGRIKTWDDINAQDDEGLYINTLQERAAETAKLYAFLRYHFQDNSVYISGEPIDRSFETATLNPEIEKFYKIAVQGDGNSLTLTTAAGETAHVLKGDNKYNIMARDYKFNNADPTRANRIETSSFAVIHQVDKVLNYKN
jgi:uncharacterized surface protein with fasciclin (FAS1) repeats